VLVVAESCFTPSSMEWRNRETRHWPTNCTEILVLMHGRQNSRAATCNLFILFSFSLRVLISFTLLLRACNARVGFQPQNTLCVSPCVRLQLCWRSSTSLPSMSCSTLPLQGFYVLNEYSTWSQHDHCEWSYILCLCIVVSVLTVFVRLVQRPGILIIIILPLKK
jgi:hypothetical protein